MDPDQSVREMLLLLEKENRHLTGDFLKRNQAFKVSRTWFRYTSGMAAEYPNFDPVEQSGRTLNTSNFPSLVFLQWLAS